MAPAARSPRTTSPRARVWFAVDDHGKTEAWVEQFPGDDPQEVLRCTRERSLQALLDHLG